MSKQPSGKATDAGFVAFDFGTAVSRVAALRPKGLSLVTDVTGEAAYPAVLALSPEGGVLAGTHASERRVLHPEHTVVSLKPLITATAAELQARGPFFPHAIDDSAALLQLEIGGRPRHLVELLAHYLGDLRRAAEVNLERAVRSGVLTVPVSFSPFDRQVLHLAASMAGFHRLRLIDETTAVGLHWAVSGGRGRAGVIAWGAGFLNVAILEIGSESIRVRAARGAANVGGEQIDLALARDFLARVVDKVGSLQNQKHVARHLLSVAETVKRELVAKGKASMGLTLAGGEKIQHTYTADDLENWLRPLREEADRLCAGVLADAGLAAGDVDILLMSGGVTQIKPLATYLGTLMGREVAAGVDTLHAAVLGAGVRACLLDRKEPGRLVLDGLTSGLGIEGPGGTVLPILERGTTLPAGRREVYTTFLERQTEVAVQLFGQQGADWRPVAQVEISKVPPMKAGLPVLEVAFSADEDGLLHVTGTETTRSTPLQIAVRPLRGLVSTVVESALDTLPEAKEEDFRGVLRDELCVRGRFILDTLGELARRSAGIMTRDEKQLIAKKAKELEEVMEGADPVEIRTCAQELEEVAAPLLQRDLGNSLQSLLH